MQSIANIINLAFHTFLFGVITFYPISRFQDQPLYCSHALNDPTLTYSLATIETHGPWIALDINLYKSHRVNCGDKLILWREHLPPIEVIALDAGRFTDYYVDTWPTLAIIADLPEYYSSKSQRGMLSLPVH